ncbi:helix-turn-helix domain-containing protein [Labilibaculum sp. A4]|uniref:Helix-turn-helix domain-containing protein n=2 Tax=Labilibaculum TaxID=2060722 RepID=A0A425YC15_9BACT|nr:MULTISPECIES: AraC family transcriptional regulator [Labilibaculum]MDQ1772700.1 AraC family transcriptional regulator [Labilibaculum euxinus]MUP38611.1 helix-turn-helix domain-containing protein [Labilibaculum euxinus]MVB07816.1 helix-turn-helix domain-containing protein [Labilibaculum euxinus]MWN76721.1 helix-turn-helix domain-containing protein [Labilibaculum euxinus]PKQ69451.1 AraC family transcriptional regulator [Labilibaculum manganireducens]
MKDHIHREITPLQENDCFLIFDRERNAFNFPIHFHPEFEINYIHKAKGGKRIIGDHIGEIQNKELVMVGPNLYHGWENYKNDSKELLHEITIQFPRELFDDNTLNRNMLKPIRELLNNANRGILFSEDTTRMVEPKLIALSQKRGFDSYLAFQSLLYDLAISREQHLLTNMSFHRQNDFHNSERIERIYKYIQDNFQQKIKLEDAAALVNMSVISFSRLIKQRTGKSFVEFVIEIRLGIATRLLIETNKSIAEICFDCGFNNISNFNRIFKKKQDCTPSEFRMNFNGTKNVY